MVQQKPCKIPGWHRILAAVLAVSMMLIPIQFPVGARAAEEYPRYFEDNFDSDAYLTGVTADGVTNKWDTLVSKPEEPEEPEEPEDIVFHYKWNVSKVDGTKLSAQIVDGVYQLTSTGAYPYVWLDIKDATGTEDASHYWKDYTVEADIVRNETSGSVGPSLIGRVQYDTVNNGYTYYKAYMHKTKLYLMKHFYVTDQATGKSSWKPVELVSKAAAVPFGNTAHISLTMVGDQISAAISWTDASGNPQTVSMTATDDQISYGTIGLEAYGATSSGNTLIASYDNVKVTMDNGQVLFAEDFSDERYFTGKQETVTFLPEGVRWNYDLNYKWNKDKRLTAEIVNGAYQLTSTSSYPYVSLDIKDVSGMVDASGAEDASHYWKDYTVEADMVRNETSGSVGPSLIGRLQYDAVNNGYTYYKAYMHNTRLYLMKHHYVTDKSKWMPVELASETAKVPFGSTAHISLTMIGNQITAAISWTDEKGNPQTVSMTATDDQISYGTIGLEAYGATSSGNTLIASYDNVKVTMDNGQVLFAEDFSTEDYFNGKTETVTVKPADTDTDSGTDTNGGYTVHYRWDESEFNTNPSATWADGKYTMVHTSQSDKFAYLNATGDAAATNWKDYTVSTDVTSHYHSKQSQVYLLGRVQKSANGYEAYFATIIRNNDLRVGKLWWNGSKIEKTLIAEASPNPALSTNDPTVMFDCRLSMTVAGNTVTGLVEYNDGTGTKTARASFTDDGVTYGPELAYGNIGLGIMGTSVANEAKTVVFDNVEVTLASGEKVFADDFTAGSYFGEGKEETVNIQTEESTWAVADGALSGKGSLYMTSTDGTNDLAAAWKDYAVDADVMLNDESTTASILAHVTDDSYYELRLSNNALALYSVTNGTEKRLATTKGTEKDRAFKLGQWHTLKLEIDNDGKTVLCYANNEQLLVYIAGTGGAVHEAGKMGLRVTGSAKFDNVAAYAVELSDIKMFGTFKFEDQSLITANWNIGEDWTVADKQLCKTGAGDTVAYLGSKCVQEDYNAEFQLTLPASGQATVMGRYSAETNSAYKVTVDPNTGVTLNKMVSGTDTQLKAATIQDLYLAGVTLTAGSAQNVKLYMCGNLLQVYINGNRVLSYVDTNAPLTSGVAAISGSTGTQLAYVTTTVALPLAALTVLDGTYSAANTDSVIDEDHPIQVPLGKVPDVAKLWLKTDADEIVPLDTLKIGQLDGSTVGKKSADVIYDGQTVKLWYQVIDRSAEITELVSKINALKAPAELVIGDAETVETLYRAFVDLSAREKETAGAAVETKLMAAREAILDLQYTEDLGEIVFTDTFDSSESEKQYTNDYNVTGQVDVGNWYVVNGEMLQYDTNKVNQASSFTAANMLLDKNFRTSSVSVDVQFMEPYAWVGFMFNMENREWYTLRITDDAKSNRVVLNKSGYATETYTTYTKTVDPSFEGFQVGQWYNLRVTVSETGLIRCYVDGRLWYEHQDQASPDTGDVRSNGTVALIASENWVKYDNLEVRGVELPYVAADNMHENPNLPQQNYTDNFEDETEGSNPSHWVERTDGDRWLVKADGTNKIYASKDSLTDATQTWLYVFETDVDYTAKLRADQLGKYPVMALTARVYADTSYFRAGYDFTVGKWFIKTRYGADFSEQTFWGTAATVTAGQWYTLNLKVQDTQIALYVDGSAEPVAVADAGRKVGPGKVGVYTEQCNISVDDVDLKQLSGQSIVQDGAVDQYTAQAGATAGTLFSVMEVKDAEGKDALLMYEDSNQYISYDDGMTWTKTTVYSASTVGFSGGSVVKLHDGSLLNIKNNMYVKRSVDGGLTWTTQCADMTKFHASGRKYSQPGEHLSEVQLADGTWRIFYTIGDQQKTTQSDGIVADRSVISEVYYSDDLGVTWKMSENSPLNVTNLSRWCESHVLGITKETKDFTGRTLPVGTLVHYSTYNSSDAMRYSLSFDGGVTWEGDYAMPEIPCGMNSMTIDYDHDAKVYYMATWMNIPKAHDIGFPRERVVLLVSEDGYNWKLAADVDRWGDVSSTDLGVLMQGVNMYLYITEDYVFVSFSRSEAFSSSGSHNLQRGRMYRFEKSKLAARDWAEQYVIPAKTIIGIEAQPAISQYQVGSQLVLTGNKIKVSYYDGTSELVDMDGAFVHADLSAQGQTDVTVDYKHFRTVYPVSVFVNPEDCAEHAGTWVQTATTHKQICTYCNQELSSEAAHTWTDGKCEVCGYAALRQNLQLNDILRVKFHVNQELVAAGAVLKVGGKTLAEQENGSVAGYSTFYMDVLAQDMLADITATLYDAAGQEILSRTFKLETYLNNIKDTDDKTAALADATLSYCQHAAYYKNKANEPKAPADVSVDTLKEFTYNKLGGSDANIKLNAYLDESCDLQLLLPVSADKDYSNYTVSVNGGAEKTVGQLEKKNVFGTVYYVYRIEGILPQNYDVVYTFKVMTNQGQQAYQNEVTVLGYLGSRLGAGTTLDPKVENLMKAMYHYYVAAEAMSQPTT